MGPGEHRPNDHEYWTPPWSTTLFAGDLFEAIPFGDQPTVIYTRDEEPVAGKHFVGDVASATACSSRPRATWQISEAPTDQPTRIGSSSRCSRSPS